MKSKLVIAAVLLVGISPSQAAIVDVTYTGTVNSGYDVSGIFGAANMDLSGDLFTIKYRFDTSKGYTYSSPNYNYAYGNGSASPSLGAIITINGKSASIAGSDYGQILGQNLPGYSTQLHYAQDAVNGSMVDNSITNWQGGLPSSITAPLSYFPSSLDDNIGLFQLYGYDSSIYNLQAFGYLTNTSLTIAPAVPEPSTWAMMLLGFAGMGFLAYRKSRQAEMGAM